MATNESIVAALRADRLVRAVEWNYTLPSGLTVRVVDFKPLRQDDAMFYRETKSLLLRRGTAAIYVNDILVFLLAGLPKFGYVYDQFTTDPTWPVGTQLQEYVFTTKENGEAGHIGFFKANSRWFAIVGSKNVHIVFDATSAETAMRDVAYYDDLRAERLRYAVRHARLLIAQHPEQLFGDDVRAWLYAGCRTIVFEAIYDDHIVDYQEEAVKAFAITWPQYEPVEVQGLAMDPKESFDVLRGWGFRVPRIDFCSTEDGREALEREYQNMENSEGAVVYEVFGGRTVGKIWKHKNYMYVTQRMARELIKRRAPYPSWVARFEGCQKGYFDNSHLVDDIRRLLAFYVHLCETRPDYTAEYVHANFKNLLKEFGGPVQELCERAPRVIAGKGDRGARAVMLVGLVGAGKTTLRNALLRGLGGLCTFANQDEHGGKRKSFLSRLKDHRGKLMIVDKCNHLYFLRDDVYKLYANVLIVEFTGAEPGLCSDRIQKRGLAHLSLVPSERTDDVVDNFFTSYEPVSECEKLAYEYLALDTTDTREVNVCKVHEKLRSIGWVPDNDLHWSEICDDSTFQGDIVNRALKKIKYWRASARVADVHRLVRPRVEHALADRAAICKWTTPDEEEYHVTLAYGKRLSLAEAREFMREPELHVRVLSLVYDDKCVALRIAKDNERLSELCDRPDPHMTLGCVSGVPHVYANELMRSESAVEVALDVELRLTVNPVL